MPISNQYLPLISSDLTAGIASGQTASGALDLEGNTLCGIYLPSNFAGTTLTLMAAPALSGSYVNILSGGSTYTLTGSANSYVPIESMPVLAGVRFLTIVSGTTQTGNVTLTLATRPI